MHVFGLERCSGVVAPRERSFGRTPLNLHVRPARIRRSVFQGSHSRSFGVYVVAQTLVGGALIWRYTAPAESACYALRLITTQ